MVIRELQSWMKVWPGREKGEFWRGIDGVKGVMPHKGKISCYLGQEYLRKSMLGALYQRSGNLLDDNGDAHVL